MPLFRNSIAPFSCKRACGRRALRRLRPRFALAYERLEDRRLMAYDVEMVKDINLFPAVSTFDEFVAFGDKLYFNSSGGLWATDGTESGTSLIGNAQMGNQRNLVVSGDFIYFVLWPLFGHEELWRTDGTDDGTIQLTHFATAPNTARFDQLTDVNGTIFFVANDGINGRELYKSDGTVAGTQLVRDIAPGSTASNPTALTNYLGKLYFTATDTNGSGLWNSDEPRLERK